VRPVTERQRRALLTRAKGSIRKRYAEFDFTLDDVAEEVGTSRRQLQRVFAELEGEDFRSYLLRVRMERARTLLSRKRNPLSIRATAPRVGYRKPSGLRQAFKRQFGINPSEVQPEAPAYLGTLVEPPEAD
jgi:two-component system response regulator YesN